MAIIHTGKDFNGNELHIGDEVAFIRPHYRALTRGKVLGFTPKMIAVEWANPRAFNIHTRKYEPATETIMREIDYVVKMS